MNLKSLKLKTLLTSVLVTVLTPRAVASCPITTESTAHQIQAVIENLIDCDEDTLTHAENITLEKLENQRKSLRREIEEGAMTPSHKDLIQRNQLKISLATTKSDLALIRSAMR